MKKKIALAVLAASVLFSASAFASENVLAPSPVGQQQLVPYGAVSKDGYFKGIRLAGKVKVVKNFGDIKVQVVKNFPDLKVKKVSNFPNKIGEWQFVENSSLLTTSRISKSSMWIISPVCRDKGLNNEQ